MAYNDNSINRDVILNYALSTYGTEPEYPWESSPDNAVLRNMMSGKWYAIIMCVKRQILGLDGDGFVDVMNVKCDPILVGSLRMKNGFLPAYHMNKDKWISILLDGSVSREEIFPLKIGFTIGFPIFCCLGINCVQKSCLKSCNERLLLL